MTITSVGMEAANSYSLETLTGLLNHSFEGYAITLRESSFELARRIESDGVDLGLSTVAVDEAGKKVGLCLVARRDKVWRIAAMGVVPAARRRGIGAALMERSIEQARAAGAESMLLEVFEQNLPARALYDGLGFVTRRRLVGFTLDETGEGTQRVPQRAEEELVEISHLDVARALREHGPANLPWQMQPESIAELGPPCRAFTLGGRAFALVRETCEGVMSLRGLTLVHGARGRGIGRRFVMALRERFPGRRWRIAPRVPEGLADRFFLGMGFERMALVQLEMELPLQEKTGTG